MIRINLLPDEYRRTARTPIKMMLAVSAIVALNSSLAAWSGWLAFGVSAAIESDLAVLQTEDDGLRPQVDYHNSLDTESKQHSLREKALADINDSRISWTRKLDEFVDVVSQGGDGSRHLTWFDSLTVVQDAAGGRAKTSGSFKASGHSGSDKFGHVANFLDDLEASPFIEGFNQPASPEGSESVKDEDLMPPVVWAFPLVVELKAPEDK